MLISKKADVGLRVIRYLAKNGKSHAQQIADEENISQFFVQNVGSMLCRAGILQSFRGAKNNANAGYILFKALEDISLYDVIMAINGPIHISQCIQDGHACEREASTVSCNIYDGIMDIQNGINEMLKKLTLDKMLKV